MQLQQAKVTIKGNAEARNVQTKNGMKTVYEQAAQLETEGTRFQFPVSVNSPAEQYPLGDYVWDVVADVVPSQYGPELARRMTLVPMSQFKSAPAAATAK